MLRDVLKESTDITWDCNIRVSCQQINFNQCSEENYLIDFSAPVCKYSSLFHY